MLQNLQQWMHEKKESTKNWLVEGAKTRRAQYILAVISFTESSFFPIPPDVFLIPMIVAHPRAWVRFTTNVVLSSILGALFGYVIGLVLNDLVAQPLIDFYSLHDEVRHVGELFDENAFTAVFLSAFTPIPFKVFTISAGLFHIHILPFFLASALGRGLRFFIEGAITRYFGHTVSKIIYRYFDIVTLIVIIAVAIYFIVHFTVR